MTDDYQSTFSRNMTRRWGDLITVSITDTESTCTAIGKIALAGGGIQITAASAVSGNWYCSHDDETYTLLCDSEGTPLGDVTIAADRGIPFPAEAWSWDYIKLVADSGTANGTGRAAG